MHSPESIADSDCAPLLYKPQAVEYEQRDSKALPTIVSDD
jgi:hypothetical protein